MTDDKRLERIENKMDRVVDDIGHIKETTAANLESLKAHMARTAALEQIVLPLERRYQQGVGISKAIGFIAVVAGIIESIVLILSFIRNIHV